MPLTWKQLKASGFDRDPYRNCDRYGKWNGTVDAVAYSLGGRMTAVGKGNRAGIHLYLSAVDTGEKFWLYVFLMRVSPVHDVAKTLNGGDQVRVEVVHTEADHAWVKSLEKLAMQK